MINEGYPPKAKVAPTTNSSKGKSDMIPANNTTTSIVPWTPLTLCLPTEDHAEAYLTEELADLRNGTTVIERSESRFTPDIAAKGRRGGRVAWPPVYSRPLKFDPFGDENDASDSPQSFYDSYDSSAYGNAATNVNAAAPITMLSPGPTRPRPFRFDPFGDSSVPSSPEYYHQWADPWVDYTPTWASAAALPLVPSLPKNTHKATFDLWGDESNVSHSPDSFYASDDSKVKCTVTATGKIWAPVPRVPMGPALAAFEVHAFAALLPSPMVTFAESLPTASFECTSADEKKCAAAVSLNGGMSASSTPESEARVERGVFTVFEEEEEEAPTTEVPREVNGNAALYQTATTRGKREVFTVFREDEEDYISAERRVPREVNESSVLYATRPQQPVDMVTAMKDLLRMEPGKAKDEMASRIFGGGVVQGAAPNAPMMSTVPLPTSTTPVPAMTDDEYLALVPAPPQPSSYPNILQLSFLRVLRQGY